MPPSCLQAHPLPTKNGSRIALPASRQKLLAGALRSFVPRFLSSPGRAPGPQPRETSVTQPGQVRGKIQRSGPASATHLSAPAGSHVLLPGGPASLDPMDRRDASASRIQRSRPSTPAAKVSAGPWTVRRSATCVAPSVRSPRRQTVSSSLVRNLKRVITCWQCEERQKLRNHSQFGDQRLSLLQPDNDKKRHHGEPLPPRSPQPLHPVGQREEPPRSEMQRI